jgi:hypothetical protein
MDDIFDFYFAKVEGEIASIFVNMTIEDRAPVPGYGHIVVVRLTMRDPRDDGLSSDDEFDALAGIDDALYATMSEHDNALYVGRVTYAGLRDFYYYAVDAGAAGKAAARAMKKTPAYKFEILSQADADWTTFKSFLLPSPRDRQRMGNRNASDQLRENGDPLTEAREIDHYAYFPTPAARDAFAEKVTHIGYKLRAKHEPDPASAGTAYGAQIYREDVPGNEMFDAITAELAQLAKEAGGDYDGWEAPIKPPPDPRN